MAAGGESSLANSREGSRQVCAGPLGACPVDPSPMHPAGSMLLWVRVCVSVGDTVTGTVGDL